MFGAVGTIVVIVVVVAVAATIALTVWAISRATRATTQTMAAVTSHWVGASGQFAQAQSAAATDPLGMQPWSAPNGAIDLAGMLGSVTHQWDGTIRATMPPDMATAGIKAHDPGFTVDGFYERVGRVFFLANTAHTGNEADALRGVVGPLVEQQWRPEIERRRAGGVRNVREMAVLGNTKILGAQHSDALDVIQIRIRAAMADYDVDAGGAVVRGDREVRTYCEDWTFTRDAGARTGAAKVVHNCHHCGAPYDGDLRGKCRFCGAPQVDLGDDWILARIAGRSYVT